MQRQLTFTLSVVVYSTTNTLMYWNLIGDSFSPLRTAALLVKHYGMHLWVTIG